MTSSIEQMDIDTSSLVNEDELNNRFQQSHGELQSIVGDDSYQSQPANRRQGYGPAGLDAGYQSEPANRRQGYRQAGVDAGYQSEHNYASANRLRSDTNISKISTSRYIRPTMRNPRVAHNPHFYESVDENEVKQRPIVTRKIKQSKHLPGWMWSIVTSVLGINESKKWLATALYVLTLFSALAFTFFGVMFVVYDVTSKNSTTTIHIGFISLVIGFGWLSLGIYSFRLAGRLFGDKDFAASIRRHSRTVFKISSALILTICGCAFAGLNLYNSYEDYSEDHCHTIGLHHVICHTMFASRVVFTTLGLVWNLMVGCMLLSVCRTHTIGIRRFVRDLEEDGKKYEDYWRDKLQNSKEGEYNPTSSVLSNHDWFVVQENDHILDDLIQEANRPEVNSEVEVTDSTPRNAAAGNISEDLIITRDSVENGPTVTVENTASQDTENQDEAGETGSSQPDEPPIMTEDEILLCYWKISNRMRFTSQCLQRWLASWVAFVGIWIADYVIFWLSHSPDVVDILEFCTPMLLIFVLSSAYAEANGEGQVMIRCICPTKERYGLLSFLHQQPLQMQVFSLSISYNAILTVILAFAVAFSSRLILDEVMKP